MANFIEFNFFCHCERSVAISGCFKKICVIIRMWTITWDCHVRRCSSPEKHADV